TTWSARPWPTPPPWRRTSARSPATRRRRRRRSASSLPSVPRPPGSTVWSSTAPATSTTVASRPWPTPPARAGWPSDRTDKLQREEESLMSGAQRGQRSGERQSGGRNRDGRRDQSADKTAYIERVVAINRVAKVVKGGRRFSFTALVIVGDGDGLVGVGYGKAKEVPAAIAKGVEEAKKSFFKVPRIQGTIPHPVQ